MYDFSNLWRVTPEKNQSPHPKGIRMKPLVQLNHHKLAEHCIRTDRLTLLVGPSGSGKSTAARQLAEKICGKPPVIHFCSSSTEIEDLYGIKSFQNSEMTFHPGPIEIALRENRPLILEEFSLLPNEIKDGLMELRKGETQITNRVSKQVAIAPRFALQVPLIGRHQFWLLANS